MDSLPRNVGKKTGSKEHVSAPWPRHLQTELTRWCLQHQKNYIKSVKCSSFLLPSFLPGKARILLAHATPRKTLNLGIYLAFQLHYAVLHTRRAAKRLLLEEEFCNKPMQFLTIIFKFKYRASSSSSYLDKFLMRYVTHFWRKLWIRLMNASNNNLLHCNLIKSLAFFCYFSRVKIHC